MARITLSDCTKRLLSGSRTNARKSEVEFGLNEDILSRLWLRQNGCCAVSGMNFSDDVFPQALVKRPFAPSIDRIAAGGPYIETNARIVCVCANFSMNEWGVETLLRLADAVVDFQRSAVIRDRLVSIWRARQEGRIAEAEIAAKRMPVEVAKAYRRRIAGLRRALTLSPEGLRAVAASARVTLEQSGQSTSGGG